MRVKQIEIAVGIFMLAGFIAFVVLAFKVSGLSHFTPSRTYHVSASFDNIGALKVRAPVTLAGVRIGEVSQIHLDSKTLVATVTLRLDASQQQIPAGSSAQILTQGILGSNYIGIIPGYDALEDEEDVKKSESKPKYLHEGSVIEETQSAIILENLIGQLMFNINKK